MSTHSFSVPEFKDRINKRDISEILNYKRLNLAIDIADKAPYIMKLKTLNRVNDRYIVINILTTLIFLDLWNADSESSDI